MKKLSLGLLDYGGVILSYGIKRQADNEIYVLSEKIQNSGHQLEIFRVDECRLQLESNDLAVFREGLKTRLPDVIIPRLDVANNIDLEVSIIEQFEILGVPVLNSSLSILHAKNKLRTMQILAQNGLPMPKTISIRNSDNLDEAIEQLGGYPVILKSPYGSFGVGVTLIESRKALLSVVELLVSIMNSSIFLLQEYIAEANSSDHRIFVINGEVIASMERQGQTGEFRSNLHRGGQASLINLSSEEKELAIKAVKVMGLHMGGVDILLSKKGPLIMEVNANPGFNGLAKITQIDIAKHIVDYAVSLAKK